MGPFREFEMFIKNALTQSIRLSLLVTGSAMLLPSAMVSAQEADEQAKDMASELKKTNADLF